MEHISKNANATEASMSNTFRINERVEIIGDNTPTAYVVDSLPAVDNGQVYIARPHATKGFWIDPAQLRPFQAGRKRLDPHNYQRFSVRSMYSTIENGQPAGWNHRVFDNVTSQRLATYDTVEAAQLDCDARNVAECHELATGYTVEQMPHWNPETGKNWRVIDSRRPDGFEATTSLAQIDLSELDARMVADWANRTQPAWHLPAADALKLAWEYFAQR